MKFVINSDMVCPSRSLPVRGAWVEIQTGANGDISGARRSPCGERGLKCIIAFYTVRKRLSLPVRGAWVEILYRARALAA